MNKKLRDIEIIITDMFEEQEKKLSPDERNAFSDSMENLVQTLRRKNWTNKLYHPQGALYPSDIKKSDFSLHLYKATPTLYTILTIHEDHLFQQKVLRLYQIAHKEDKIEKFNDIAEKIIKL